MTRSWRRLRPPCLGLVLAYGFTFAQPAYDPSIVLARVRDAMLQLTDRLPKYTCTQTVNRTYLQAIEKPAPGATCDQFAGDRLRGRRRIQVEATDRLRLDDLLSGGEELFSWAGAGRFDPRPVQEFNGEGPVGTGSFGTFLLDIFGNKGRCSSSKGPPT